MGKRITASKPKTVMDLDERKFQLSSDTQPVQPLLVDVMKDSYILDVSPTNCIPLYLCRNKSAMAIRKLKAILRGKESENNTITGVVSGSPSSIVVELLGDFEHHIDKYLKSIGYSSNDAIQLKSKRERWFGIIDGC